MDSFLGQHQFTIAGAAAGAFIYDKRTAQNTFTLAFEPLFLFKLNDWILFEGTIQALLPVGSKADYELPVATAQFFLNDYLEINAGIFDQPFGDFYEDQSPLWVNRFVTAPLPYGVEAVIPRSRDFTRTPMACITVSCAPRPGRSPASTRRAQAMATSGN